MNNWKKLTDFHTELFGLDTYEGEVILYDPTKPDGEQFYFNAQEFFTDEQLNGMDWYQDRIPLEDISQLPEKHHHISYKWPEEGERVLALYRGEWIVLEVGVETPSFEETFEPFKYWFEPFRDMLCIEYYDVDTWMPLPPIPTIQGE